MRRGYLLSLSVCAAVVCVFPVSAAQPAVEDLSSGPFCGQCAVYAAVRSLGYTPDVRFIGDEKYLNGGYGSTDLDLVKAIRDFGFHAKVRRQMSLQTLILLNKPVILHARVPWSNDYTHWMVFLGYEGGEFIVYDPPRHVLRVKPDELLTLWDGYGIVVSESPFTTLDTTLLWLPNWKCLFVVIVPLVALYLGWNSRKGRWVLASIGLCVVVTALLPPSPLTHFQSVRLSFPEKLEEQIPTVEIRELTPSATATSLKLIDVRPSAYYVQGHIPGAVNLPIDATYGDYKVLLADLVKKQARLVLYCQSEQCGWANEVASSLRQFGVRDVSILHGGMNAFLKDGGKPRVGVFDAERYR